MAENFETLVAWAREQRLPDPETCRALRRRAGLTQGDLAVALGVTRPTVTRWELGSRAPRGSTRISYARLLDRLARVLGVSVERLFEEAADLDERAPR